MNQVLEDRQAIADVVHIYAHAVDRKDTVLLATCFHPDATWQIEQQAPSAAADFFAEGRSDPLLSASHHITNQISVVDGNFADAQCYFLAYHQVGEAGPDRAPFFPAVGRAYGAIVGGRYIDRFEKRDGQWRILRRRLIIDWQSDVDPPRFPLRPRNERVGDFHEALRQSRL